MATTFSCPNAPTKQVPWEFDGESGMDTVSTLPEIEVSNSNIRSLCDLLELDYSDGFGELSVEQLPDLRRRLILLLNTDGAASMVSEGGLKPQQTVMDRSGDVPTIRKTIRMFEGANTPERIRSYLTRLLDLVTQAQANGWGIMWA